jgi:hypothetical protein
LELSKRRLLGFTSVRHATKDGKVTDVGPKISAAKSNGQSWIGWQTVGLEVDGADLTVVAGLRS